MSDIIEIRNLQSGDLNGFATLLQQFFDYAGNNPPRDEEIRGLFERARSTEGNIKFVVAVSKEKLVGLISVTFGDSSYKFSPFAWCDDFYVDPDYRNTGIGRRLLQAIEQIAIRRGCSNILAAVGRDEEATQAFYRACGMRDMRCDLLTLPLNLDQTVAEKS